MDIPERIIILGIEYEIRHEDLENEDGYISPKKQVIGIRRGMQHDREAQTFLHELVHGILDQLGYGELYEDEHLVQGLAIGLHQALFTKERT